MNRGGRSELEAWPHVGVGPLCGGVSPVAEAWPRNMTQETCPPSAAQPGPCRWTPSGGGHAHACQSDSDCLGVERPKKGPRRPSGGLGGGGAVLTCLVERVMLGH